MKKKTLKIKKEVKQLQKACDVFATTKHEERKANRLKWKDIDLDAEPVNTKDEIYKWAALQSPVHLGQDFAKPSGYLNDQSLPHSHGINAKD